MEQGDLRGETPDAKIVREIAKGVDDRYDLYLDRIPKKEFQKHSAK